MLTPGWSALKAGVLDFPEPSMVRRGGRHMAYSQLVAVNLRSLNCSFGATGDATDLLLLS